MVKYVRGINLIAQVNGSNTAYYLFNAHGDVVHLIGATTKSYVYDAFGNEQNIDANDTNPFRYCGEYYDSSSGTYYLRARYYDPKIGRFTQQDSVTFNTLTLANGVKVQDPLSLNLYTYCYNNPISYCDHSGFKSESLRNMVTACGGTVKWDEKTKTATVTIAGTSKSFTEGKDGACIANGSIYIPGETFADAFGGSYTEISGEGYTGYSISINLSIVGGGYAVNATSKTFDKSAAGEKAVAKFNKNMDISASYIEGLSELLLTSIAGLGGKALMGFAGGLSAGKTILGPSFINPPQIMAGDTYISRSTAVWSMYGGHSGNSYSIFRAN